MCYAIVNNMTSDISLNVVSIKENPRLTRLHRWEMARCKGAPVELDLSLSFDSGGGEGLIVLSLTVGYRALRGVIARPLLTYSADVTFDLGPHSGMMVTPTAVYVPQKLLGLLLSVSVGALRGMVARCTSGTFLEKYPLPVFDISELLKNIKGAGHDVRRSMPSLHFELG